VPFLVHELLREGTAGGTPQTVVESLRHRLGRLGAPAVQLARTVAVLGDEASFDAVADLTAQSVADIADPLEVLVDAGVLAVGMWRAWPAHPLVREAILSALTPSQRSDLHRKAAAHLTALGRPRQAVASHLLHTLPGEDPAVVELFARPGGVLDSGVSTSRPRSCSARSATRPRTPTPASSRSPRRRTSRPGCGPRPSTSGAARWSGPPAPRSARARSPTSVTSR
jgi:hypothetical protein